MTFRLYAEAMSDNPAQRLHDLLVDLRKQSPGHSIGAAWANLLGIEASNLSQLLAGCAAVSALPGDIEARLMRMPNTDAELFLEWRPGVGAAMDAFLYLSNPAESMQRQYDSTTLLSLRHAAHVLRDEVTAVDARQLASVLEALDHLQVEVASSDDVSDDLRTFLLDLIHEMRQAIILVRAHGTLGLQRAVERCVGAFALHAANQSRPDFGSQGEGAWQKLLRIVQRLGSIVSIGKDSAELVTNVAGAIEAAQSLSQ